MTKSEKKIKKYLYIEQGTELKALRGSRKIKDVAKALGVAPKTYYRYESGERKVPDGLLKLARILYKNKAGEGGPFPDGVREPVVEYEKGDDPFARSVSGLRQIFDSQDKALIAAIQINIQAFQLSVHKDRQINQQSKEIQKLKEKCEELKTRVDALEKRAVGNAGAGSGSRAHSGDATRKKES